MSATKQVKKKECKKQKKKIGNNKNTHSKSLAKTLPLHKVRLKGGCRMSLAVMLCARLCSAVVALKGGAMLRSCVKKSRCTRFVANKGAVDLYASVYLTTTGCHEYA